MDPASPVDMPPWAKSRIVWKSVFMGINVFLLNLLCVSVTRRSPSSPQTQRNGEKSRKVSFLLQFEPLSVADSLSNLCRLIGWAEAEAELAALEELRLSRAMAYVSINPSSVGETPERLAGGAFTAASLTALCTAFAGGCMSLEEVRLKQQQEMMQAKRKQNQVWYLERPAGGVAKTVWFTQDNKMSPLPGLTSNSCISLFVYYNMQKFIKMTWKKVKRFI